MPWGPNREPIPNVTGGSWRPRDTVIAPPNTIPGWWVRAPVAANFSGNGALAAQIKQISPREIFFNSEGIFDPAIYQKYLIPPDFNSEGTFQPQVMQREFRNADFNGMGYIAFETVSIILDDKDGLTATAWERYPQVANFSGAGNLDVAVRGYATMIANLSGGGTLSGEITKQIYAMTVAFSGNGAFTPGAFKGVEAIANFLGSGTLSATAFQSYLRALPLAGAGALEALVNERYLTPGGGVGEGTMTATIYQIYTLLPALSGNGVLSSVVIPRYSMTMPKTGNGILTATAVFPTFAPVPFTTNTLGAFSYLIPYWCDAFDVVQCGAGGGGQAGGFAWGQGGAAGLWAGRTYTRGSDIPWNIASVAGTVGDGGAGGTGAGGAGAQGGAVVLNAGAGYTGQSAAGGPGGSAGNADTSGKAPGNFVFNGQTYTGGTGSAGVPGCGGNANTVFGAAGAKGGRGQIWFRAYQT